MLNSLFMTHKTVMPKFVYALLAIAVVLSACSKDDVTDIGPPPPPTPNSKIRFNFAHHVDGVKIIHDSVMFTNLSGNKYSISKLQYLISDIRIDDFAGNFTEVNQYHFVDLTDEDTWVFAVKDSIKKADIKAISFYLGFLNEQNINSGDYADLDDEGWAFPSIHDGLPAGGYYALKMAGRYIPLGDTVPTGYTMNIGSKRQSGTSSPMFIANEIIGSLTNSSFKISTTRVDVEIRFNINRLFSSNAGTNKLDLNLYNDNFESEGEATDIVSKNAAMALSVGDVLHGQ
jgi:hypothetical protein